jgi:hypothetical protein
MPGRPAGRNRTTTPSENRLHRQKAAGRIGRLEQASREDHPGGRQAVRTLASFLKPGELAAEATKEGGGHQKRGEWPPHEESGREGYRQHAWWCTKMQKAGR